ncbi:hypothetical protein DYH10_01240 [Candidatus Saccharibacteria bacterium CPR2]|nr:hypothetical protein [Candidatus Saccharibacteria bacterium CPR2]
MLNDNFPSLAERGVEMDQVQSVSPTQDNNDQQLDQAIANLPGITTDSDSHTNNYQDQSTNTPQPSGQLENTPPVVTNNQAGSSDNNSQGSYIDSITKDDASSSSNAASNDDLQHIKDEALEKLRPLVDKLDQGPEEKFDTLLMLIRASDDKSLIKPAYEAAEAIEDDQKRAKALLDVVNEVNYLTQPSSQTQD